MVSRNRKIARRIGQAVANDVLDISGAISAGAGVTVYATADDLPTTGLTAGDEAFVSGSNRLYISNGTGWYSIGLVNTNPAITSVEDPSSNTTPFTLATDGSALVLTITAADPEDIPLTYSYAVTTGSLTNGGGTTATVVQGTGANTNQFTITPTTTEAYAGTFDLTFTTSDGINQASSVNNFTLNFITSIANSRYTTLLATATGTSDNNNITDASTNSHTITVNGDAYAGTFSPYRSGGYSTYFDGTGDYIEHQGTFTLPAGTNANWTIECWVNLDQVNLNQGILRVSSTAANGNNDDIYFSEQSGYINTACKAGGINSGTSAFAMTENTWHHIAMVKNNGTIYLYNNGVYCGSLSDSNDYSGSYYVYGGLYYSSSYCFAGHLSDFRISNSAIYTSGTSNFTVPTEPLSSSGAELHTCHLPYIADGSTNDHTITVNGNTSTKPFTPYDYTEYSATDHGGSVYFDGSGDRITASTSNNFAIGSSEDFIIEAWIYPTNTSQGNFHLFGIHSATYTGGIYFDYHSSDFRIGDYGQGWDVRTTSTVPLIYNTWQHICASRTGTLIKIFFNGESLALSSQGEAHTNSYNAGAIAIGGSGVGSDLQGFISDIRFEKGTSRTSNFTPPTAPLSSSGAELHIKSTDASIIDKSQGANLKLEGNTTGSTTQAKFASTKSMYFDGSGDYISIPTNELFGFGTNDFTVEFWVYFNDVSNSQSIYSNLDTVNGLQPHLYVYQSSVRYYTQAGDRITSSSVTTGQWYHVALSRSSSSTKLFINGTQSGSTYSDANDYGQSKPLGIATYWDSGSPVGSQTLNGYIQDLRVTKGLARYTGNFTPPTASLEG